MRASLKIILTTISLYNRYHHCVDIINDSIRQSYGLTKSSLRNGYGLVHYHMFFLLHCNIARICGGSLFHKGRWNLVCCFVKSISIGKVYRLKKFLLLIENIYMILLSYRKTTNLIWTEKHFLKLYVTCNSQNHWQVYNEFNLSPHSNSISQTSLLSQQTTVILIRDTFLNELIKMDV